MSLETFQIGQFYLDSVTKNKFQVIEALGIPGQKALVFIETYCGRKVLKSGEIVCNYSDVAKCKITTEDEYRIHCNENNVKISYAYQMSKSKVVVPEITGPDIVAYQDGTNDEKTENDENVRIPVCANLGLLCNAASANDNYRTKANCQYVPSNVHQTIRVKVKKSSTIKSGDEVITNYGSGFTRSINEFIKQQQNNK